MKRIIPLSLIAVATLSANEVALEPISVESTTITEVNQNAKVSADLAEALTKTVPSIDMSRRSGIANDIFIRGQKRDNISVEVDGTKVCGACPNRMDPPVSHVLASQIEEVEVIEGPYDVETFGTMSGGLKITTKKPSKTPTGELNFGLGSWGYNKLGTTVSGGNDTVRVLLSGSVESSEQYEDGDGNTLAEQLKIAAIKNPAIATRQYQPQYEDMKAYKKKSVNAKVFVNVTEDQELQLSITKNKSDDVLYANTPMDAAYDYSNIYSIAYDIKDITEYYKNLNFQYYYSDVDHPMDTKYRNAGATKYMTNHLKTTMEGVKLKNEFDFDGLKALIGLDGSKRTWKGQMYRTDVGSGYVDMQSISLTPTETKNGAVFTKLSKRFGDLNLEIGARYDDTEITPEAATKKSKDYNGINANLVTTYNVTKENKVFLGFGQAYRVPDARELYLGASANQNLDQTRNREIDLGYELDSSLMHFKLKGFYSMLDDYIYLQKGATFKNIDATVYGAELSASVYATDDITLDMGASYKVGEKDEALAGQTDKDLADIAPLRANIGVTYEYMTHSTASIDLRYSDRWDKYDDDNGEQEIASWTTLNAKVKHAFNKHVDFTLGVNNITDKTYAQSNTYVDLTLLSAGTETMLLNEPGRYVYTNLDIKF
ncbi:MAG: TonB-dependent receptor [Sulfurimonadaceae bacterium]